MRLKNYLANAALWLIMSPSAMGKPQRNTVSKPDFDVEAFKSCLPSAKNSDGVDACYRSSVAFDHHTSLVGGGHNEQVIRTIIAYHFEEIKNCALNDEKAGWFTGNKILAKIVVNFDTGTVRDVTLSPSPSPNIPKKPKACMISNIKKWIFPHRPLGDRFVINYPFTFNAE